MRLTTENTAAWVATIEPNLDASGPSVEDIVHDYAWRCQECGDAFTREGDLDDGQCDDCACEEQSQWSLRDQMRGYERVGNWA